MGSGYYRNSTNIGKIVIFEPGIYVLGKTTIAVTSENELKHEQV